MWRSHSIEVDGRDALEEPTLMQDTTHAHTSRMSLIAPITEETNQHTNVPNNITRDQPAQAVSRHGELGHSLSLLC